MLFDHWRELIDPDLLEDHASFSWQDAQAPQINGEAAMYLIGNLCTDFEAAGIGDQMDFFQFPTIYEGVGVAEDAPTDTMHIPSGVKMLKMQKFFVFISTKKLLLIGLKWAVC